MALTRPLVIYSRFDLNHMLLERAERAGAAIEKTRVLGIERRDHGRKPAITLFLLLTQPFAFRLEAPLLRQVYKDGQGPAQIQSVAPELNVAAVALGRDDRRVYGACGRAHAVGLCGVHGHAAPWLQEDSQYAHIGLAAHLRFV